MLPARFAVSSEVKWSRFLSLVVSQLMKKVDAPRSVPPVPLGNRFLCRSSLMGAQQPIRGQAAAILGSIVATLLLGGPLAAADGPPVKHPNLLLNRDEIDQVKAKIRQHDWAARLL